MYCHILSDTQLDFLPAFRSWLSHFCAFRCLVLISSIISHRDPAPMTQSLLSVESPHPSFYHGSLFFLWFLPIFILLMWCCLLWFHPTSNFCGLSPFCPSMCLSFLLLFLKSPTKKTQWRQHQSNPQCTGFTVFVYEFILNPVVCYRLALWFLSQTLLPLLKFTGYVIHGHFSLNLPKDMLLRFS